MIQTNQSLGQIAMLTMRGIIYVFEVHNPDYGVQESVHKVLQTSIQDVLKNSQISMSADTINPELIHIQSMSLHDNGEIQVYLSNQEKYIFDSRGLKLWKKIPRGFNSQEKLS